MQYALQMVFEANCRVCREARVINLGRGHQGRFTNALHHHLCDVGEGAQNHLGSLFLTSHWALINFQGTLPWDQLFP